MTLIIAHPAPLPDAVLLDRTARGDEGAKDELAARLASRASLANALRELLMDSAADANGAVFAPGPAAVRQSFAALAGLPVADGRVARLALALDDALTLAGVLCNVIERDGGRVVGDAATRIGRHRETLVACREGA